MGLGKFFRGLNEETRESFRRPGFDPSFVAVTASGQNLLPGLGVRLGVTSNRIGTEMTKRHEAPHRNA